jgi:predicted nuclease of predicted toxin-antitoxin system
LEHAARNGFIVVSKDEDLHQLVLLHGPPPKMVWVRLGNCTTSQVEAALRDGQQRLASLAADEEAALLILGRPLR